MTPVRVLQEIRFLLFFGLSDLSSRVRLRSRHASAETCCAGIFGVRCTQSKMPTLDFEWDPNKAESNRRKHGVEFLDAVTVFDDDRAITLLDEYPYEERYVTFGLDADRRVLAVC